MAWEHLWRRLARSRRERGATMVEYALILGVLVIGSIPAIDFMTEEAADETANQSNCISTRPPPASCLRRAGDPSYSPSPVTPESTVPEAGPAEIPAERKFTVTIDKLEVKDKNDGKWQVKFEVKVVDANGDEVEDAVVTVIAENQNSLVPIVQSPSCETKGDGECKIKSNWNRWSPSVVFRVVNVVPEALGEGQELTELTLPDPFTVHAPVDDDDEEG